MHNIIHIHNICFVGLTIFSKMILTFRSNVREYNTKYCQSHMILLWIK